VHDLELRAIWPLIKTTAYQAIEDFPARIAPLGFMKRCKHTTRLCSSILLKPYHSSTHALRTIVATS
jgi:hypothetical protein